jgi:hypothetical protein
MRNLGSSVGIAVVNALLTRNTRVNHAAIALHRQYELAAVEQILEADRTTLDLADTQS